MQSISQLEPPAGRAAPENVEDAAGELIIGRSPAMRDALALARQLATTASPVILLSGEAGVGKELFARFIHAGGATSTEPFLVVDSTDIPRSLLEVELFGCESGVISPVRFQKPGLLEVAGAGTLFLSRIDALPLWLQPKLLRAITERRLRRVGGTREIEIRCRIAVGAGPQPEALTTHGKLRGDLFNQLQPVHLSLPALRDRGHDIELLAQHFLERWAEERSTLAKRVDASAVDTLMRHGWPGNVRELRYVVEQAAARVHDDLLTSTHLTIRHRLSRAGASPGSVSVAEIAIPASGKPLAEVEREAILLTLELARGNQSAAARILGISRPTLARKLQSYGLRSTQAD